MNAAGSHHKIDLGIYRLGIFSKNAIDTHNLKCTIAAQAVGANVSFFLVERQGNVYTMTKLHHLRFPRSIAEIPFLFGFFDKLLDIITIFFFFKTGVSKII